MLPAAATPLLYLAFAAALLWATRRFIRPLSRWAAIVLTLLPLAFTGPALVTGGVYAPVDLHFRFEPLKGQRQRFGLGDDFSRTRYDVAFQMIPWRKAARYAIAQGEWPIWNPFILGGDVLAASGQPAVYHPIHLAAYLLPLGQSLTFVAAAVFFAAGLCAFLFNREVGCREGPAAAGAAGWTFCGFMLFWLGWPHVLTAAFFPLLLVAVRRVAHSPGWPAAGLLTLAFALMLLGGHPETAFHGIVVAMVYGLYEIWAARGRASTLAAIGYSAVAGVAALALTAIDLLPFVEALTQTTHFHWRGSSDGGRAVPWSVALERLRVALVPFAYGVPWSEWLRTPSKFGAHWYAYTGSVLLAPALFGLWRGRWRGRWLLAGLAAAGLLLFVAAPGLIDWIAHLPLFDKAINRRLVFVTGFAVTVLAALGLEAWAGETEGAGKRRLGWLTLGVLGALSLVIALAWPGLSEDGLSAAFLGSRTWLELLPVALTAALFLTVRSPRIALGGLLLVLVAQRLAQTGELNRTFSEDLVAPPIAALQRLPRAGPPFRVVGHKNTFTAGMSALYELEDARGNTPMTNLRLFNTYKLWSKDRGRRALIPRVEDLSRPFLSFLNVRYALVAEREPRPAGWTRRFKGRSFSIYENPEVLPRAFVPRQVRLVAPDERRIWDEMADETDFSRVAWIELPDSEPPSAKARRRNGPGRVKVERRGLGLDLEVHMKRPGWVVVSQTAWKGWRAFAGGREIPVHFANHAFLAFHLPEGDHQVDLVYRPRSFVVGRAVSLLTLGFLAAVALGVRFWDHPSR